jgi:hypothetical protein
MHSKIVRGHLWATHVSDECPSHQPICSETDTRGQLMSGRRVARRFRLVFASRFETEGAPSLRLRSGQALAFSARAGTMLPIPWDCLCRAACIVPMARTLCTLSPVHAIGDCLFSVPRGLVIASSRFSNRRVGATVLSWSAMLWCRCNCPTQAKIGLEWGTQI